MEPFDKMVKEMAEREEIIVPNGFDERIQNVLDSLPPKAKKGLGAAKTILIAAAACAALLCTAFAASPGLRGMLIEALGSFAPYAQDQEGEAYVINGIEFRVKSVLADDFTVRAYVEAKDLEGGRLSADMNVYGLFEIPVEVKADGIRTSVFRGDCLGYDEGSKTALLSVTTWGQPAADDLSGSRVRIWSIEDKLTGTELLDGQESFSALAEVQPIGSTVFGKDAALTTGFQAEEVRLSALGLSVLFRDDEASHRFSGKNVSAKLTDGTLIEAPWEGGQGNWGYGTENQRSVLVWNFREPVDVNSIEGIYVGEDYFPLQ